MYRHSDNWYQVTYIDKCLLNKFFIKNTRDIFLTGGRHYTLQENTFFSIPATTAFFFLPYSDMNVGH